MRFADSVLGRALEAGVTTVIAAIFMTGEIKIAIVLGVGVMIGFVAH